MATTHSPYEIHDHAGAKFLVPFLTAIALLLLYGVFMLAYPNLSMSGQV